MSTQKCATVNMFRQYSGQKNGSRGLNAYGQIPLALTKYEDIAKDVYLSAREDGNNKKISFEMDT